MKLFRSLFRRQPEVPYIEPAPRLTLEEELAAIEQPADTYRIGEDIATGTWWVDGWKKRIECSYGYFGGYIWSGYERLVSHLPTRARAERWLAAHVDPESHRAPYDADGKRIEAASQDHDPAPGSALAHLHDKIEGLETDLFDAVSVAYRRGAVEWTRLNYPSWFERLKVGGGQPVDSSWDADEVAP